MGAVADLVARWLPADVPVELFVGWTVWLLGGLLLMLWFMRRSTANRVPPVRPVSPSAVVQRPLSGTHTVASRRSGTHAIPPRPSGTHAVARKSSGTHPVASVSGQRSAAPAASGAYAVPKSHTPIPDAYSELSLLLDSVDDQSRSNH